MEGRETSLQGTIDSVVYQNDENGYTVLRLDVGEEDLITVVGCIPGAAPGETLQVQGNWTRHVSYGEQFKADAARRSAPQGKKAVFDYLASGAIKGIGASTAQRMVKAFGARALEVLENEPEKLASLKGMTRKRAQELTESFRLQMGMRRLLDFLTAHALPLQMGASLYRRYGDQALETLQKDPYILTQGDPSIPFAQADALAIELGFSREAPERIEAGILFELQYNLENGHTFLPRRKLVPAVQVLLDITDADQVSARLDSLRSVGMVREEPLAGEDACYLTALWRAETRVAERILELCEGEVWCPENVEDIIDRIEREQELAYAPQQRCAVKLAAQRQIMLLTGGPGTGKTTSLRGVLALFETLGLKTALAAPTGRAAKRLGELCDAEATTIHRLLEMRFHPQSGDLVFAHDENDPLKVDAVIVDELSMVDISLMSALLSALRPECRLVLVGDPDQLPSVGPGNLLSDLIRSGRVPTVRLTEVFRQAAQSGIIQAAHAVNEGRILSFQNERAGDCFFLRRDNPEAALQTIVELVGQRLPERMGIPADQIQVLSPTRKYVGGTKSLNEALQAALNPHAAGKGEKQFGSWVFREGDRVMQVKNNYDVQWQTADGLQMGLGIFNGDIGRILKVDNRQALMLVDFDGHLVEYTPDMLGELEPAYAVTVHKSQGSEYRAVVLAALDMTPRLLTRGVLYTAITRARELLVIVGNPVAVAKMTANNRQRKRYSGLRIRLTEEEKNG